MKNLKGINASIIIAALAITIAASLSLAPVSAKASGGNKGILYYGSGCPHCAKVESFLKENNLDKGIIKKEIYHNPENADEFNRLCDKEGISLLKRGVPFLFIENKCFIGDQQIINYFKSKINNLSQKQKNKTNSQKLTLPLLIGAALVDAINPCAFAVLLILMMTVLATGERKKALFSGLSFSTSVFISYFLMGLGIYSVIASFQTSQILVKIIGGIAIILGLLNLKDFFWYGKGFLMEIPLNWRPRLKKIISGVTSPFGAFLIGFLVSLFLLPCTSGPYIVIIGMLGHKTTHFLAIRLLILYNLIFILPMLAISIGTYFGINVRKAEEKRKKNLKILHLVAGIIMITMGIYLMI